MRALSKETNIDFMGVRHVAAVLSLVLVVASILTIVVRGFNFGIDFTGGVLVEVGYPQPVELDAIRSALTAAQFGDALVQHFGSSQDVLIRLAPNEDAGAKLSNAVYAALQATGDQVDLRRIEFVGPQVGEELTEKGGLAMLFALMGIFIYVLLRFHWKFSTGAVAALAHDVILVLGLFSMLQLEFDLAVLAALLAVIGYSLNDTIVVFDRCRENFRRKGAAGNEVAILNISVNQMLSRTLMTSVTTLLVLVALYVVGGEALAGFSLALIAGVVVGTYSSIYVAGNVSLLIGLKRDDLVLPTVEALDDSGAQV